MYEENVKLVNLTPHSISVVDNNGTKITIQPSGVVARVSSINKQFGYINRITVLKQEFGDVENVPEPKENTIYIVSALVLGRLNGRNDVVCPATFGSFVNRDDEGKITSVKAFVSKSD